MLLFTLGIVYGNTHPSVYLSLSLLSLSLITPLHEEERERGYNSSRIMHKLVLQDEYIIANVLKYNLELTIMQVSVIH